MHDDRVRAARASDLPRLCDLERVAGEPFRALGMDVVDGAAHVEQVSVHPGHARQGLGRALLEAAAGWAREAAHGLDRAPRVVMRRELP